VNEPGARIRRGTRVVYAGQFHGEVLFMSPEQTMARVLLDNGTADWFRTDLMVPEGEHDPQEPTPGAWVDRAGFLWLEAAEPGSRRVFCYDAPARRRMGDKWPVQPLEEAEREFGPMERMVPVPQGPQEDEVVFLHGGGSTKVPASYADAQGWGGPPGEWAEVSPGCSVALLSTGSFWVSEDECAEGAFVVIRRAR
jgi:hypothetical protein